MWFKNLQIYRLRDCAVSPDKLEEALASMAFRPCGNMDMQSRGWLAPRGEGGALVHVLKEQMLIALGVEQKLLPSAVINQYAQERAEEIEEQQGYKPGRKQLREIRERVAEELLPRAFARRRKTYAWIDPAGGWLVIDAASPAKADELVEALLKCSPDITPALVRTQLSPMSAMTGWLAANEAPAGFSIDRDCELLAPGEEKSLVRYVRHPLESAEIRDHIESGKQVTKLAMTWNDRISFVLNENMQVKRLAFLDLIKEESEQQAETADEQFDADFAIMSGELARFLPDLVEALGGEAPVV
ncbi:MAG: recombination-associated protein RdgC [Sulfurimicrobium sp.]|jgi:recombination associated protein RdgC|nr:recombination-associated protein RdgC [Sulfurimicrobium sp.]MDP1705828.1 recombination-associated protein RdgC [Sulfurimicrobium sp.]MDP2198197.1 recombination-associated protein RdgC [Sulfurimicrobium sp.]MDP3688284.1 recombination-associated protein RdgC [Sulfurimicrobium sp.]MDZ7657341.1 recombination-associated protein RdgC [Sulfurimicrobium sp.]